MWPSRYAYGIQNDLLVETDIKTNKTSDAMKAHNYVMSAVLIAEIYCCSTSCIIDKPIMLNICGTVWETKEDSLGYMAIDFQCYEEGRFMILTNSQGDIYTGIWSEGTNSGCTYSLDLVTRSTTTKEEMILISGEITTWSRKADIMRVTYTTRSSPHTLQKTDFIRIKE